MNQATIHGSKRLRERVSTSKRQVELAIKRGYSINNYSGSFRRYLDKIKKKEQEEVHLRIYGNHIYIFNIYWILITVLNIPTKYLKYKRKEVANGKIINDNSVL